MKVTCNRAALAEALGVVASVVATRTPKPVLQCVRVNVAEDSVTLLGTDLEVGIRYEVGQVTVAESGDVLVPADRLAAVVRESTDEVLELSSVDHGCRVRGGDSQFDIYGQDPREFPPVAEMEGEPDLVIKAGALDLLISRTLFAAARESTRYAINGILWEKRGKKLRLIATDGRRLARAVGTAEQATDEDSDVIVPTKAMGLMGRLLGDADEGVRVRLLPNQVLLATSRATISSVLVEGRFPKYEDVIPQGNDKKVEFSPPVLLSAVRRAALLTTEESKGVRFALSEGQMVLSSRAPDHGEATITLQLEYTGPALEVGFNPTYVVDALKMVGSESVTLELSEANKPGLLKVGNDFLYVVMPVSLA